MTSKIKKQKHLEIIPQKIEKPKIKEGIGLFAF
jgi:hypothetical protein